MLSATFGPYNQRLDSLDFKLGILDFIKIKIYNEIWTIQSWTDGLNVATAHCHVAHNPNPLFVYFKVENELLIVLGWKWNRSCIL
jgi:hypothetical protein